MAATLALGAVLVVGRCARLVVTGLVAVPLVAATSDTATVDSTTLGSGEVRVPSEPSIAPGAALSPTEAPAS